MAFSPAEMREATETLIRYRVVSMDVLRKTDRDARSIFARDIREGDRRTSPQMQLALQILGHFAPTDAQPAECEGPSLGRSSDSRPDGHLLGGS